MNRRTAILIAAVCLAAGLGIGLLLKNAGPLKIDVNRPSPSPSANSTAVPRVTTQSFDEETSQLSVNVEYPELQGVADNGIQDRVNNKIKADVYNQIASFHAANAAPSGAPTATPIENLRSMFAAKFTSALITGSFYSGTLAYSDYSAGAAHPNNYLVTLNYNLKTGDPITLDQFLRGLQPASGYFERLSQYVIEELVRKLGNDPDEVAVIRDGAAPIAENYQNFTLDKDGLTILFDPYQVGPYALGSPEVKITYDTLFSKILKLPSMSAEAAADKEWWLK